MRRAALVLIVSSSVALPLAGPAVARADVDLAGMDKSVAPGDDFFAYASGAWLKKTDIPADRASWGVFTELAEETGKRTRGLLEEAASAPAGSDARRAGDYYATYLDEAGIDAKGTAPLKPALDRIEAIGDKKALARTMGEDLRADVDPLNNGNFHSTRLFGLWIAPEMNEPTGYAPYLLQGGLGMPDRAYYVDSAKRMVEIRGKYEAHVAATFKLAGIADAEARARRVVALETKMARAHASRQDSLDVIKANNPWKPADFTKKAPGLDWAIYLAAGHLDKAPAIVVWEPGATKGLAALVASEPLAAWKDWLTYQAIDRRSEILPKAFVEERFGFFGKTLTGVQALAERWKRGVATTNAALPDAVGQIYAKKYFPPESKAQVQAMVKNIIAAFDARIDRLDWMAPSTKAKAKEKLATLYVGIGYPDTWHVTAFDVVRGDAVGNEERAEAAHTQGELAKLGHKVDATEWAMAPQTVNAVNLPIQNALNFPAAILQPPFFDPAAAAAVNYGAIGAVIGHEISHSFDDQGAQFDAHGKLTDWWTPADRAHFQASGKALAAQYDAYKPFPDIHVNGKLTLSENIADLAGISASHDAWLASLTGKSAPESQGLSGEQQFFLAFGQVWRTKTREASMRQSIITNGHAPGMYRAETVRNLDSWYDAFACKPGQALYLAPKARVRVW